MKKYLFISLCTFGGVAFGAPFMNHSFSPLIVGVSQFHQYNNPRFDINATNESSESYVRQNDGSSDLGLSRKSQKFKGMLFQRMPKAAGGLGIKFSAENHNYSGTRSSTSNESFFFKENSTDWIGQSQVAKVNPFISYSLTDYFTMGFEFRANFYNVTSETDSFSIENQYGVASTSMHWKYVEIGGQFIPKHREAVEDPLDGSQLIEDQSFGDTTTIFARARVLDHFSVGASRESYRIDKSNGTNASNDQIKAHAEWHVDESLNLEGYIAEKEYLESDVAQGKEQELYGALIFRSQGHSSFALSYANIVLKFKDITIARDLDRETSRMSISGHWKL